jgi:hypothetical protein
MNFAELPTARVKPLSEVLLLAGTIELMIIVIDASDNWLEIFMPMTVATTAINRLCLLRKR